VGQTLWVTSNNGVNSRCELTGIDNGVFAFERHFAGGSLSFDLSAREIKSLRIIER
jgi:hypothetical protein